MSFIDKIVDALLEVHLFEMAYQRKQIVDKTRDKATQIASHISKIALYPEHSARKHWENEVHSWIKSIDDMKFDRSKKLATEDYHKYLYKEPFENTNFVDHISKQAVRSDGMFDHKWTDHHKINLENKIKKVYHDISSHLSNDTYTHISETLKTHEI